MEDKDEILSEELNFEKPDFTFIPKGIHQWRQQGYFCICKSCELEHAIYIGSEKILVGLNNDGSPILKNRSEIFRK